LERRIFDHVDLRVRSFADAVPFYDKFMPLVGLNHKREIRDHVLYYRKLGKIPAEVVVLFEDSAHVATQTTLAFYAATYEEVDKAAAQLKDVGVRALEGPILCPEYSETYYAVFFRDPSGNRLEVVCRKPVASAVSER